MWTELCEHLAATYSVTVLTAAWNVATPVGREENSVQICSIGSWVLPKIKNRHLWEALLWLLLCAKILGMNGGFDLVICVDTPRFSAIPGWLAKWRNSCKLVSWVLDLPLEQVVRRSTSARLAGQILRLLNNLHFKSLLLCDKVVVLGKCMRDLMLQNGASRVEVIGPWADEPSLDLRGTISEARQKQGIPDIFTLIYLGYAGAWHEFEFILEAIPVIISKYPIQFVFAGQGPGIDRIAEAKDKFGWDKVLLLGWVPREKLGNLPLCGDIHLVSLKQNMLGTCVPSKTYGALAYGRPVIFIGPKECQAAQDILDANAGSVVKNAGELVAAINGFFANPVMLEIASQNARLVFLEKHQASVVFKKWDELIEEVVN